MKKLMAAILCAAVALGLTACVKTGTGAGGQDDFRNGEAVVREKGADAPAPDDNDRVFYEIFVGSFSDSDGDGIGDLRGIINRMDYLNDGDPGSGLSLGIEGIWLTPIFSSPSYHKYDVTDYRSVDPAFGTADDLKELIALCHERGVKVILDLPINHTGRLNSLFAEFCSAHAAGDTLSPAYDRYSWRRPDDPARGAVWEPIPGSEDYYECNFSPDMPELNFDSEDVRNGLLDLARFWLDLGADGFRFDAAKYVYYGDNDRSADFWKWYIGRLREIKPDIYTVAEVWDIESVADRYIPASNCFDFTAAGQDGIIARTAKGGNVNDFTAYTARALGRLKALRADAMPVYFIANHDTDRAAGYLGAESADMRMAANLYILSPGSPFLYYGEELGLRGSRGASATDANRRLAMPWCDGDTVRDPEGANYANRTQTSAAEQKGDAGSLYSHYKRLLLLRRANPEIARGEYTPLTPEGTKLGGFVSEWEGRRVCVVHNTSGESLSVSLADLGAEGFETLTAFIGAGEASLAGGKLTVGPQTTAILR